MRFISLFVICALLASCVDSRDAVWRYDLEDDAAAGNPKAIYELGLSHCCGPEGEYYDTKKALTLICAAAKDGYPPAQLALGRMYENGDTLTTIPIDKDDLKAYMWYSLAASSDHPEGTRHKALLGSYMTVNNLKAAEVLLEDWQQEPCVPFLAEQAG